MGIFGLGYRIRMRKLEKEKKANDEKLINVIIPEIVSVYTSHYLKFKQSQNIKELSRLVISQNNPEEYTVNQEGISYVLKNGEKKSILFKHMGLPDLNSGIPFSSSVMQFQSTYRNKGYYDNNQQKKIYDAVFGKTHSHGVTFFGCLPYINECHIVGLLMAQHSGVSYRYYHGDSVFKKEYQTSKTW
ncbi:MAG: hypothetical protein J6Q89_07250 [Clostridia bacterium]|nr:hypothetical protein [Clostridia bacterium]